MEEPRSSLSRKEEVETSKVETDASSRRPSPVKSSSERNPSSSSSSSSSSSDPARHRLGCLVPEGNADREHHAGRADLARRNSLAKARLILRRVVQISQHDVNLLQHGAGQRGRGQPRAGRRRRRRRREHGPVPSGSRDRLDDRPLGPASSALGRRGLDGRPPR